MKTWIVAANASRARIFETDSSDAVLTEVDDLAHPASRVRDQDLTSDLPGRSFDSYGAGRHAMEQPTDPKGEEAIKFAVELADYLSDAKQAGRFERLYLICGPHFLGLLRAHLDESVGDLVAAEIDKDVTLMSPAELHGWLPSHV